METNKDIVIGEEKKHERKEMANRTDGASVNAHG